jgi:hypothetical protein
MKFFENFLAMMLYGKKYIPKAYKDSNAFLFAVELQISPRIFEKNGTALTGYSGAWGKLIHEKKT